MEYFYCFYNYLSIYDLVNISDVFFKKNEIIIFCGRFVGRIC